MHGTEDDTYVALFPKLLLCASKEMMHVTFHFYIHLQSTEIALQ